MIIMRYSIKLPTLQAKMIDMQVETPGCFDNKLLNDQGLPYVESEVGLNPLMHGYAFCAPLKRKQSDHWIKYIQQRQYVRPLLILLLLLLLLFLLLLADTHSPQINSGNPILFGGFDAN